MGNISTHTSNVRRGTVEQAIIETCLYLQEPSSIQGVKAGNYILQLVEHDENQRRYVRANDWHRGQPVACHAGEFDVDKTISFRTLRDATQFMKRLDTDIQHEKFSVVEVWRNLYTGWSFHPVKARPMG